MHVTQSQTVLLLSIFVIQEARFNTSCLTVYGSFNQVSASELPESFFY
jgi:hypothetical protein